MIGRTLLLVSLCVSIATGCSVVRKPREPRLANAPAHPRPASRESIVKPPVVETSSATMDETGWLAGARRRLAQVSQDIRADLDFHDTEGLEAFAPDAVEQVNMLRGDMNGAAGITR